METVTSTLAEAVPGDPGGIVNMILAAYRSGAWAVLAGLVLSLVVMALRYTRITEKIPATYDKWVAMGLSMLSAIAIGLTKGESLLAILSVAVQIGITAIGNWEILLKPIRDRLFKKAQEG